MHKNPRTIWKEAGMTKGPSQRTGASLLLAEGLVSTR